MAPARLRRATARDGVRRRRCRPAGASTCRIEEDLIEEVIRVIGFDALPASRRAARSCRVVRERKPAQRGARCATRWPTLAGRRRSNSASSKSAGSANWRATPTRSRVLNPIAEPLSVMRSSLIGSLIERAALQPGAQGAARARVRDRPVFRRDAAVPDGRRAWPGCASRCALGGLAYGPAEPLQWGVAERAGRLLRREGRCRGTARAAPSRASSPPTHPALHPGRSARDRVDGMAIGCRGRTASALAPELRAAAAPRACSNSTLQALTGAPRCRSSRRCREQQSVCRDLAAGRAGRDVPHER